MRVSELIAELRKYDQNAEAWIEATVSKYAVADRVVIDSDGDVVVVGDVV